MNACAPAWFEALGRMLDALQVGMCLFDEDDCTQAWNQSFLRLFPEHRAQIHRGEPYAENLRRFYRARLEGAELANLERYVQAGIERHQQQFHPYDFLHRGERITVASLPLAGLGRLRLWRILAPPAPERAPEPRIDAAALLDRAPSGLVLSDDQGRITWANDPFAMLYGLADAQAALGRTLPELFLDVWMREGAELAAQHADEAAMLQEIMLFTGSPFELQLPGGRQLRVLSRSGATGGAQLYAHLDVTELQRQRERLAQAERNARIHADTALRESALLQAVLHGMQQGIAMVSAEGRVDYHNQRLLQLLDLAPEYLQGRPWQDDVVRLLREGGDWEALSPEALAQLSGWPPENAPGIVCLALRQRSSGRVLEVGSVQVPGGGVLHTVNDVTERHAHQQHIEHMASHDGLTGLLNRGRFLELLAAEIALAQRSGARLGVLYVDLDGFKPINDVHGHAAGDEVLRQAAQVLQSLARESDFVARLGGDEFAVLQRGIHQPHEAQALAVRAAAALAQPVATAGAAVAVGASIGVALYPEDGADPQALLAAADQAMYRAKARARPRPLS